MGLEFLDGNEAIARGALAAGCDFFAGYPITPSSTILHHMLEALPRRGGTGIQCEDEIASMGFCIGAAMAGAKVLTATSGPGISLYSENIGLALIGETPMVIVDVQRQGPATGSATKGAEGDVQFARWCTSGGLPMVVLSPATVAEAYRLTYVAFNLAERLRVPVMVLANKEIGLTRESVDLEAVALPERCERTRAAPGAGPRLPHAFEEVWEVPPMVEFGAEHVARFTTSTHDEAGYLTGAPATIQHMIDHYAAKVEHAADLLPAPRVDGEDGAETLVVSYGVTSRAAGVAAREARARGARVASLVLPTLFPVPENALREAMAGVARVVVPEMNMGQYRLEVERLAPPGVEVAGVNKMDTTLLSPAEILAGIGA